MYFWRAKKERALSQEALAPADATIADGETIPDDAESKVVTIAPARLADRLAQAGASNENGIIDAEIVAPAAAKPVDVLIRAAAQLPGQKAAIDALREALANHRPGFNILVLGASGTGRRSAVRHLIDMQSGDTPSHKDWLYFIDDSMTGSLQPCAIPNGEAPAFARACDQALAKSATALDRLLASDDYAIGLQVLDEEFKQASDKAFDVLKRRAEAQNIALVKTPEGYVLAPMHDGRVVKSDVFRSLPEALQRDVEDKISSLESELKSLISEVPGREAGYGEKLALLNREVASRALYPHLNAIRAEFAGSDDAEAALKLLETRVLASAAVSRGARAGKGAMFSGHFVPLRAGGPDHAPVVFARDVTPVDFTGVMGHDASRRLSVKPGHLLRANGGYLIVEAWRLASAAGAWETLSAAIDSGRVAPQAATGLVVDAEPVPLSLKLVVIADDGSWTRLKAIDPGIERFFPSRIRFASDAAKSDVDEAAFGILANLIAESQALLPLDKAATTALYEDACRRSGSSSRISLDLVALSQSLALAGDKAARAGAGIVRRADIDDALSLTRSRSK